jgi:4-hydroxy-tetrahydrodipicolinate reductase
MGQISKGSIAGYRFEVVGRRKGREIIAVEHVTRLDDDVAPEWARLHPGGFRVLLEGSPSHEVDVVFKEDDPNIAACTGTAARAVNSVATVCEAQAGVCSFLDLPMITAAGSFGVTSR